MKKIKVFFAVAALLLVTAGVFAGKAKYTASSLFYYTGVTSGTLVQLTNLGTSNSFTTTQVGTQAAFQNSQTSPVQIYPLYNASGAALYINF